MTPKRTFLVMVMLFVAIAGGLYYATSRPVVAPAPGEALPQPENAPETQTQRYTSFTGLSFTYPADYIAITPEFPDEAAQEVVTLFTKSDYEELQASTEPREGPTAISLQVFSNEANLAPQEWVAQNAGLANYSEALAAPRAVSVDDQDALRYRFTGLYEGDAVAVAHGGYLYLFSVTWMDAAAEIRGDFESVLASVSLP